MKKDKKIPRYLSEEKGKNVVVPHTSTPPLNYEHPIFCFKYLHKDYGIHKCSNEEKVAFVHKLEQLSQMTWHQIQHAGRHGAGSEKISKNSIKPSVPSHITDDIEHFLSLRFDGMKPMIGYRSKFIFHLLYLDPKFQVYSH